MSLEHDAAHCAQEIASGDSSTWAMCSPVAKYPTTNLKVNGLGRHEVAEFARPWLAVREPTPFGRT
jgi:hypothetical protein